VEVGPGIYQVEVAESWLKLVPEGQGRIEAVLVDATSGMHEEPLSEVTVRLEADSENPDVFHLAMLLQDGTGLESIGTKSGIRPRGWRSAFVSKLRKPKTFASRGRPSSPKAAFKSQLGRPKISLPPRAAQVYVPPRVPVLPKPCLKKRIDDFKLESPGSVKIDCQLTLPTGPPVKKRLIFETTGVTLNCNGRTLGDGTNKDVIEVRSRKYKDKPKDHPDYEKLPWKWERPQNVTIKKCNIIGSVRVWGMATNGEGNPKEYLEEEICIPLTVPPRCQKLEKPNSNELKKSSRKPGHTKRIQANAPKNIVFDEVQITGVGRNPFYVAPGVTYTTLMNSTMNGKSDKVAIYLDAESAYNTFKNNNIDVATAKDKAGDNIPGMKSRGWPIIAIDGSSHNKIVNNRFSQTNRGGIYLYRNCGEGGTIRHATPSHNVIINNIFYYNKYKGGKPSVYLGSRDYGFKERTIGHCDADDGRPYGSSASEKDYARHNVVMQNQFYKRRVYRTGPGGTVLVEASIADYVKTRNTKANSPNYIEHNQIVTPQTVVKKRRAGCYLPNASPNFLFDGRSLDTLKDSGNKACLTQSSCTDGELSRSNASDCRVNKVDFSCQVSGNNKGCQKEVACPSGKKLVGAKAACNLEFGTVSSNALQPILPNLIKVLKASDKVSAGSCHVGGNKLQSGQKEITINKSSRTVAVGCKEHDKNGGDCHIKGNLYCR
jgi:parallel beta-helix repeat protein